MSGNPSQFDHGKVLAALVVTDRELDSVGLAPTPASGPARTRLDSASSPDPSRMDFLRCLATQRQVGSLRVVPEREEADLATHRLEGNGYSLRLFGLTTKVARSRFLSRMAGSGSTPAASTDRAALDPAGLPSRPVRLRHSLAGIGVGRGPSPRVRRANGRAIGARAPTRCIQCR